MADVNQNKKLNLERKLLGTIFGGSGFLIDYCLSEIIDVPIPIFSASINLSLWLVNSRSAFYEKSKPVISAVTEVGYSAIATTSCWTTYLLNDQYQIIDKAIDFIK